MIHPDITRVTPGNTNTLGLYQHIGARGRSWSAVSRVKGFVEAVLPRSSYTMHRTEEREKTSPPYPCKFAQRWQLVLRAISTSWKQGARGQISQFNLPVIVMRGISVRIGKLTLSSLKYSLHVTKLRLREVSNCITCGLHPRAGLHGLALARRSGALKMVVKSFTTDTSENQIRYSKGL